MENVSFIIEGQDCSGKSSLIEELMRRDPDLVYHHFMFPRGECVDEKYGYQRGQFELMFDMVRKTVGSTGYIFDRAHIGEYIWGPIYRGRFPKYMRGLEEANADLPIVLVCVTASPETIVTRFKERGEPIPDDVEGLGLDFVKWCTASPLRTVHVDSTYHTVEQLADIVLSTVKEPA